MGRKFFFKLSGSMQREFEFLGRATGLSEEELIRASISILGRHVQAASRGREIVMSASGSSPAERLVLPFKLKEYYSVGLPKIGERKAKKWRRRLIKFLSGR